MCVFVRLFVYPSVYLFARPLYQGLLLFGCLFVSLFRLIVGAFCLAWLCLLTCLCVCLVVGVFLFVLIVRLFACFVCVVLWSCACVFILFVCLFA